jgi:hypothetical protein
MPGRVGRFLCVTAFVAAVGWLYVEAFDDSTQETSAVVTAAVRLFSSARLDKACSDDGLLVEKGRPCAETDGFRFVLGPNGRYELFAVEAAGYPQRVADSDDVSEWRGSDNQFEHLKGFTTVRNDGGE